MTQSQAIPQVAVCVGNIPPDNDENVWGDFFKLIIVSGRFAHPNTSEATTTATSYIMLGARQGKAFMKTITEEEARQHMANEFRRNAISSSEIRLTPSPLQQPPLELIFG